MRADRLRQSSYVRRTKMIKPARFIALIALHDLDRENGLQYESVALLLWREVRRGSLIPIKSIFGCRTISVGWRCCCCSSMLPLELSKIPYRCGIIWWLCRALSYFLEMRVSILCVFHILRYSSGKSGLAGQWYWSHNTIEPFQDTVLVGLLFQANIFLVLYP